MDELDNSTTVLDDDDVILPEGYAEGDDIFDQDSWTGGTQADEPAETDPDPAVEEGTEETEATPTTESADDSGVSEDGQEEAPTTEPGQEPSAKKLKFTARVDRADLDVEVDESELPTLYQKAQVTDRVQAKLARLTPQLEKAEKLAKSMGYTQSCAGIRVASAKSSTVLCRTQPRRIVWRSLKPRPSSPQTRHVRSRTCARRASSRRRMRRLRSPRIIWRSSSPWNSGPLSIAYPPLNSRKRSGSGRRSSRRPWSSLMPTWSCPRRSLPGRLPTEPPPWALKIR